MMRSADERGSMPTAAGCAKGAAVGLLMLAAGTAWAQEAPSPAPAAPVGVAAPQPGAAEPAPQGDPAIAPSAAATQDPAAGAAQSAAVGPSDADRPNSCFIFPAKLPEAEVGAFLNDPQSLVAQYGNTSISLSNRTRSLAGSDSRTLAPLVRLAAAANADQKAAIGAGPGRAAFACAQVVPSYAAMIQAAIADGASPELLTAFLSATNDLQTAALGGGAAAATGAGLGGGGIAAPGSAGLGGDEVVAQTAQSILITGRRGGRIIDVDDSGSPSRND